MEYKKLGNSDLVVSVIGFGCMSLTSPLSANQKLIDKAIDGGINFFDTADIYQNGDNEIFIGNAVRHVREKIILATKVGNKIRQGENGFDWDPSKKHILENAEKSLKRLGTDYIDLYQLHGGMVSDPIDETIEAFEMLKQQGKIRAYGISSIRPNVISEYVKRANITSVMMQYSVLDRRPEEECLKLLQQNNIAVLARGSVGKGLLIDKPAVAYLNYTKEEVENAATAIATISNEKRSKAQTAIRYALNNGAITAAVTGIRTEKQLADAIQIFDSPALVKNELDYLNAVISINHYDQHR